MPFHEPPADLAHAPPAYPFPTYDGLGDVAAVRLGAEVVGHLVRQGTDRLGFLPRANLGPDADTLRVLVFEMLDKLAADGQSVVVAWSAVLRHVPHDNPITTWLNRLRRPFTE